MFSIDLIKVEEGAYSILLEISRMLFMKYSIFSISIPLMYMFDFYPPLPKVWCDAM